MPSRRSVPGDFPEAPPWLTMSSRSSEIWKATPTSLPNAVSASTRTVHAGEARAEPGGRGDQRAGLVGEHREVVGDRVLARLSADGLPDLPGDQPLERLRLDPDGLRAEVGEEVRRRANSRSPVRIATLLVQRLLALGAPRRTAASSMTSS